MTTPTPQPEPVPAGSLQPVVGRRQRLKLLRARYAANERTRKQLARMLHTVNVGYSAIARESVRLSQEIRDLKSANDKLSGGGENPRL